MAVIRPRDLLSDALLERLGGTRLEVGEGAGGDVGAGLPGKWLADPGGGAAGPPAAGQDVAATLRRDVAKLGDVGYLNVALPPEFGGLGCTLRQAACGQRRLARRAPLTALAVSAHLYWTGAAADAYRTGDDSVRWILLEAARGALFAGGHGAAGGDLRFADPRSRCDPAGESGYRFRSPAVLSSLTPAWDWVAVHAVHPGGSARPGRSGASGAPDAPGTPDAVLAFAGRGLRCTPAFRVARVQPVGTPGDVFTTSALAWGHSILASVQYSDARRAFNAAVAAAASAAAPGAGGHPLDQWPVAEAGLRLDAMKAKIADVTHPWPLVPWPAPDLGGQRLVSIFTMRHEVADGARQVLSLTARIADVPAVAAL
jgi:alkylation response protein AidB-like acyl-CoA dehydrogenase